MFKCQNAATPYYTALTVFLLSLFSGWDVLKACVQHGTDPVCLRGPGQGWTPSLRFHRLPAQQGAPGEEAAAESHFKVLELTP